MLVFIQNNDKTSSKYGNISAKIVRFRKDMLIVRKDNNFEFESSSEANRESSNKLEEFLSFTFVPEDNGVFINE